MTVITRPYGPDMQFPDSSAPTVTPASDVAAQTRVPLGNAVAGSNPTLEGQGAAAIQDANREKASFLEATGAAITQWTGKRAYDAFNQPHFEPDAPGTWNPAAALAGMRYPLTLDEEQFLLTTKSRAEFEHKVTDLDTRKDAERAMGDNTLGMMLGTIADPAFIAISAASGGVGGLARVAGATATGAKLAAGTAGFATSFAAGTAASKVTPISESHIFAEAMFFGAAEGLLFRGGKMVAADETFPAGPLRVQAEAMENSTKPIPHTEAHPDFVGPSQIHADPANNLTRSRVAAGGEGTTSVKYGERGGSAPSDYVENIGLSRAEQEAIHTDGVTSVHSVADIAEHSPAVRNGSTVIADDAKAVYLPGEDRVYLIRSNIKAGDDVKGILLHEVGVHMNAERVLGTAKMSEMLSRLEDLALSGNRRARAAFEEVPKDTPAHLVREEALGYYVERNHAKIGDNIVGRFVSGMKDKLRAMGLKGLKLSENDILQLVRKAAKAKAGASFDSTFPYAWHGSAVKGIEQLDTKFIGTGEGNQAFGFGHYLTSEKGTALDYRNKESLRRGINAEDGGLYRVKINAKEHQFVDFDGKVQSATVQAAFAKLGVDTAGKTGQEAYIELSRMLGGRIEGRKAASEALWQEGVAGNKYATGRTRGTATTSSNYVVYHNDALDMAARYSKASAPEVKIAEGLSWSLHKTVSSFGPVGKKVADLLMDNPLSLKGQSVASEQRAILADFAEHQTVFENSIRTAMAEAGYGTRKQITNSTEAIAVQHAIEKDVATELARRNRLSRDGLPIDNTGIDPKIVKIADEHDHMMKVAFDEQVRSKVPGIEGVEYHPGYFTRRWDNVAVEGAVKELVDGGMTEALAKQTLHDALTTSIVRASGMDAEVAQDIAQATLDRARRKGYFEDTAMRSVHGPDEIAEVRDILLSSGISNQRVERALQVMTGKSDEAGKAGTLKHRVDMALDEPIGGTGKTILDLIDTRLTHSAEGYLRKASAQSAMARKGLGQASDLSNLRKELLESIPEQGKRAEAAKMFDGTVATLMGTPVGEDLNRAMRISRGLTQMVGLKMAGLFQFTEFSTLMARHGMAATVGNMVKEFPGIRSMLADPLEAGHLRDVLVRNSTEDMRMRPFVSRMEDNFEIGPGEKAQLAIMQAKQLVPYLNGLKYVQGYQARVAGNMMVKTLEQAAKGDVKALAVMEGYGLESHIMGGVRADIAAHGMDTAKWSDATWDAVRAPINRMLDDHILRSRVGELPAFAQFSTLGKFLFTFRSFVLGAHNKVLAGTIARNGFAGLGLMLAYQLPLTYVLTQLDNTVMGKPPMTDAQAIGAALTNAGSMGLLSELVGVALGNKQQFGAPGTIAIDRAYKLGTAISTEVKHAAKGEPVKMGNIGAAGFNSIPLLSVITPLKVIPPMLQDKHTPTK